MVDNEDAEVWCSSNGGTYKGTKTAPPGEMHVCEFSGERVEFNDDMIVHEPYGSDRVNSVADIDSVTISGTELTFEKNGRSRRFESDPHRRNPFKNR